jgi:hypothetical protein
VQNFFLWYFYCYHKKILNFSIQRLLEISPAPEQQITFAKLPVHNNMDLNKKIKNITRMEYEGPHGWWVRFKYDNKSFSKFFNDKKYGGKEFAFLSAYAWMKNTKEKEGIPNTPYLVGGGARSNTGVRGVSYSASSNSYFASWNDANGKPAASSFSVKKYGKKKAFKLACAKREKMEALRLAGYVAPVDPYKTIVVRDTKQYSKKELIEILQKKAARLGRVPISRDFKKTRPTYHKFCRTFGSWNKAIEAAGLSTRQNNKHDNSTAAFTPGSAVITPHQQQEVV